MRPGFAAAASLALALTACGSESGTESGTGDSVATMDESGNPGDPRQAAPPMPGPTGEDLAVLDSRDCREVAQAYADAVQRKAYSFAARFWIENAATAEQLAERYDVYIAPEFEIANVMEEGGAGTLYCTVTGALGDATTAETFLREGRIMLTRANDIPGATEEQRRWRIQSSTFMEAMQRVGKHSPA